jgi:hypothetical protein
LGRTTGQVEQLVHMERAEQFGVVGCYLERGECEMHKSGTLAGGLKPERGALACTPSSVLMWSTRRTAGLWCPVCNPALGK